MFALVPYAEGFFILFSAILLNGLHRRHLPITLLGLLGCCLTRSASTLFVPSYVFAELLAWGETSSGRVLARNLLAGLATMAASVGLVVWAQTSPGEDWLAFYKVHASWGHEFMPPDFPLFTSAGTPVLWLDALGVVVGLAALAGCAGLGVRWLVQRWRGPRGAGRFQSRSVFAGLLRRGELFHCFLPGRRPGGHEPVHPGLGVLGRALLAQAWTSAWRTRWVLAALLLLGGGVAVAAGAPSQLQNFAPGEALWYFGLLLAYAAGHWFAQERRSRWFREIATGLYFTNLLVMVYLLNQFLNQVWVN